MVMDEPVFVGHPFADILGQGDPRRIRAIVDKRFCRLNPFVWIIVAPEGRPSSA
jgi:hypothetical protein